MTPGAVKTVCLLFFFIASMMTGGYGSTTREEKAGENVKEKIEEKVLEQIKNGKTFFLFKVGASIYYLSVYSTPQDQVEVSIIPNRPGFEKWNKMTDKKKIDEYIVFYERLLMKKDIINAARASFIVARSFFMERLFDKAALYFRKSLKLFDTLNDRAVASVCYLFIGLGYSYQNKYEESLTNYLACLKISQEIGNKPIISACLNNIGKIYYKIGNYDKALEIHYRGLDVKKGLGLPMHFIYSYQNIGDCYNMKKEYLRAIRYYKKALDTSRQVKNPQGIAEAYSGMAECYSARREYSKSLEYSNRSLEIAKKRNDKALIAQNLYQLAVIYMARKQFDKAEPNLEKSLELAVPLKDKILAQNCHRQLAVIFETRGQFKQSLEHYKSYSITKDRLAPMEIRKRLIDIQLGYQSERQQQTIAALEKDNEIKNLRLSKNELIRNLIIAGFVLLLAVVLFFARRYIAMLLFWKRQKYAGSYRLLDKIGSGGMGTVYKARDIAGKSGKIAVKVLREELFDDQKGRERFEREAKIVSSLSHPNIVKMIEYGMHRDKLFIAMELLEGKNLASEIKEKGRIEINRAVIISCQIADALVAIHELRFVHRDLKPENIMLVPNLETPDRIKLLDFGLARGDAHTRLTATGIIVGTLGYMPPEMVTGSHYTAAGDVYALGVIMYEMVTGERPFYARSTTDMMRQILNTTPTPPRKRRPEIPEQLDQLIMLMLEKEEENRPTAPVVLDILNELGYNTQTVSI